MGGLSGITSIALSGLSVDEAALSVTSNNIANVNTPGYSREVVDVAQTTPINVGQITYGTGVTLQSVKSVRDNILAARIADENGQQSQSQSYLNTMNQVQTMFNDDSGTGLQSVLSSFYNSFSSLATNPTSTSMRESVITAAQNLATAFNQDSTSLQSISSSLDQRVTSDVSQVNSLTAQIAQLNAQIGQANAADTADSSSDTAGMLEDQQSQLVQTLSGLLGTQVNQTSNGMITVTTSNGAVLVAGNQSYNLDAQPDPVTGHTQVYSQGINLTSSLSGGDIGGLLQARDQGIAGVQSQLDTLAAGISNSVNTQSAAGYDLSGKAGAALFTAPPADVTGAAANMAVNITDPSQVAAASTADAGDGSNALALANLQSTAMANGQNPIDTYSTLVSDLGNNVSEASTENTAQGLVLTQLRQQQSNECGVSLDEEAVNLIQYQQAYEASARVISTVSNVISTLMQMGGNA
jgi:flagellar hook-associated protein 1 FlgK